MKIATSQLPYRYLFVLICILTLSLYAPAQVKETSAKTSKSGTSRKYVKGTGKSYISGSKSSKLHVSETVISKPTLTGRIEDLKIEADDAASYKLIARIKFELTNTADRPLIFLKELDSNELPSYVGARLLTLTSPEPLVEDFFGESYGWSPRWQAFKRGIDSQSPSPEKTTLVLPGKKMHFEDTVRIYLPTEEAKHGHFPKRASFEELRAIGKVVMKVTYRCWSGFLDVDKNGKKDLSFWTHLQKSWKSHGYVWKNGLVSQPIVLDIPAPLSTASAKKQ